MQSRELEISRLPIEIQTSETNENVTRIVSINDLQLKGKQNIIIIAGDYNTVKDALITAKIEGTTLFNSKETFVIPVVFGKEIQEQIEDAPSKGFAAPKEGLLTAPYIAKPTQVISLCLVSLRLIFYCNVQSIFIYKFIICHTQYSFR